VELFEDEAQRSFYRDLGVLEGIVDGEKTPGTDGGNAVAVDETIGEEDEKKTRKKRDEELKKEFEEFSKELVNAGRKELVDQAAIKFVKMNCKINRKRLVKTLFNIQRTALPLIPCYARLAAILNMHFK
jgi:regulator of nonsense transcripts 2